ncbi:uncharacterized protein LAJ45_10869 [Morchella importuna]|uniref:uncharacterized protein n=1 Tax=Morchella importuna TaxID=1174673 RepID=UPI001E8CEDDE|nr:uncharacterized protein LAJ45_10869 [Morchella importuna]KAH8145089.1 hypothetical protein LAJ45_10869 [Morchella importuna]
MTRSARQPANQPAEWKWKWKVQTCRASSSTTTTTTTNATDRHTATRPPRPPPAPKTHELKAKLRNTTQRDDISAQEALRRQLNNERNRRTRQRKIEREIASGVRHKDGRVRRSTERPWC